MRAKSHRRHSDESSGTCQASESSKLRSGGFVIWMSHERSGSMLWTELSMSTWKIRFGQYATRDWRPANSYTCASRTLRRRPVHPLVGRRDCCGTTPRHWRRKNAARQTESFNLHRDEIGAYARVCARPCLSPKIYDCFTDSNWKNALGCLLGIIDRINGFFQSIIRAVPW